MTKLPALRAPLPVLVDEVLRMTAKLHPDEALARLGPLWAGSKPGLAQRALLAARVTLMRQAMTATPLVAELPEPEAVAEPEPEPVFVPAVPPKPAPLNRGALTLLNLEEAAKMLMAGGGDDDEAEPVSPPENPAKADAMTELAGVIAAEAAVVDTITKAKKPKAKPAVAVGARPMALDLAAQFADMAQDAPAAKAAPLDLAAQFAAMGADDAVVPAKPAKKAKAAGLAIDLSAQFAAMGED